MADFGFINGEFINLYSKDNPILEAGNNCYFLFSNDIDYHRPLIAKGTINSDNFSDGMSKNYYIKLTEILESQKVINEFLINKQISLYSPFDTLYRSKLTRITHNFDFSKFVIKVDSFFVRLTEEKITELRNDYISILKKDILKQLKDIEEF